LAHVTMEWLRHYHQVRFMYKEGGVWDPQLAMSALPLRKALAKAVRVLQVLH
jgi:hypothetical protein